MKQKRIYVVVISVLVIMISLVYQGTYSYFTSAVEGSGNTSNNVSNVETNNLQNLVISEGANVTSNTMIPGESVTFTFTINNPNTIDVCFNLLWSNTTNTFVNQKDLIVKLTKEDGTEVKLNNTQFPTTNSGTSILASGIKIKGSTTDTYTITVTYQETDEDQTGDIGKSFGGSVIGELGECYVPLATEYVLSLGETDELKFDGTVDNNLRYVGANPNNYVSFNNELWRIIGVMNNIDDGTGKKETRLKIIRDEPIGAYSWDNKGESGENDWSDSALQIVLNEGAYWNRTSGECPSGKNGATTVCNFSDNGITSEAKQMIGNTLWHLGGSSTYIDVTASMFYERERGTTVYSGHATEWIGKIGLMYSSDYGYATSGGVTTNREACLNKKLYNWTGDCYNNDWLYNSLRTQWTITSDSSNSVTVFIVMSDGFVNDYFAYFYNYAFSPALYLSSNVKISGGEGTESNPYILSL